MVDQSFGDGFSPASLQADKHIDQLHSSHGLLAMFTFVPSPLMIVVAGELLLVTVCDMNDP